MKPKKLIMSAFGPYAKEVEINFNDFQNGSIILISGETGAGKTTIFDGISYALYGKVSGENRGVDCLRSDFADISVQTFVTLTFEHKGLNYTITRSPKYLKPKLKNPNDFMTVNQKVSLTLPDGVILDKLKAVDDKVINILGIDHQQFKQIVMIAQGEFLRLLLANSNERGEILRRVFNTEVYDCIQNVLKEKNKSLADKLNEVEFSISQYYNDIQNDEDEPLDLSVYQLKNIIGWLKEWITNAENEFNRRMEDKERLNLQIENLNNSIAKYDEYNKYINIINQRKQIITENTPKEQGYLNQLNYLKSKESEREKLGFEINEIEKTLPEYQAFSDTISQRDKLVNIQKQRQAELNSISNNIGEYKVNILEITNALGLLSNIEELQYEKNMQYQEVTNKGIQLKQLFQSFDECVRAERNFINQQKSFEEITYAYKLERDKYNQMEEFFYNEQAGILAQKLLENQPCPVCGSKEHPVLAVTSENAPTQESLKRQKSQSENLQKQYQDSSKNTQQNKTFFDTNKEYFLNELSKLNQTQPIAWENSKAFLDEKYSTFLSVQNTLKTEKSDIDIKYQQKQKLVTEQNKIKSVLEKAENNYHSLKDEIAGFETQIKLRENEIYNLKAKLKFVDQKTAETELQLRKNLLTQMKSELEQAERIYNQIKEKILGADAIIKQNAELTKELSKKLSLEFDDRPVDTSGLTMNLQQLKSSLSERENFVNNLNYKIQANKTVLKNLINKNIEYIRISNEYAEIQQLFNTANGMIKGQKIKFETYVQQVYFEMVLTEANKRLQQMSEQRYTLLITEDTSSGNRKVGLDLDVLDAWTRKQRSVKSLSGGEAFKASLALALALSDVIQHFSGGIELGTMFIDEGFGSLDRESLDKAMEIISELADSDKLVGIISHIEELKERIDSQILIKRDTKGSTINVKTV